MQSHYSTALRQATLICSMLLGFVTGPVAHAQSCTRAQLSAVVDQFFTALEARDPAGLALAPEVKFTENGQVLQVGEGFWQTAGEKTFHRSLLDTQTCGSVSQALIGEQGREQPAIYGVRLKLDNERISEMETYIAREAEFAFRPEGVPEEDGDDWEALLGPGEERPRETLIAAANVYFDMFFDPANTVVPFAMPCNRWENGTRTTRDDCSNMGPAGRGGMRMTNRRFPVVDFEAGISVGFVLFGGGLLDLHMFKIRNGRITQIQSVIGPRSATTGWEEQEQAAASP